MKNINLWLTVVLTKAIAAKSVLPPNQRFDAVSQSELGLMKVILPSPEGNMAIVQWSKYDAKTNIKAESYHLINHETGTNTNITEINNLKGLGNYQWITNNKIGFSTKENGMFKFWMLPEVRSNVSSVPQNVAKITLDNVVDAKFNIESGNLYLQTFAPEKKKDPKAFDSAAMYEHIPFGSSVPLRNDLYSLKLDSELNQITSDGLNQLTNSINSKSGVTLMSYKVSKGGSNVAVLSNDVTVSPHSYNITLFTKDNNINEVLALGSGEIAAYNLSPDDKYLAYVQQNSNEFLENYEINLYDIKSKTRRTIFGGFEGIIYRIDFTLDSQNILAMVPNEGSIALFQLRTDGSGVPTRITGKGSFKLLETFQDSSIQVMHSRIDQPNQLMKLTNTPTGEEHIWGSKVIPLIEDSNFKRYNFQPFEAFNFTGANQDLVYGYMLKPSSFDPKKKYPLINYIHGGPNGSMDDSWDEYLGLQVLSQAGFVVIGIDYHGAYGYGNIFTESVVRHWGDLPHKDIIAGTQYVIDKYPFIDSTRVAALGHSFGGYITNLLNGHNEDKLFKAFVTYDGVSDLTNLFYTSIALDEIVLFFKSRPFDKINNPENAIQSQYHKFSPSTYVDKWETPTLIVHSSLDYQTHISEGLGAFTALQAKGVRSKFLFYPDEGHVILKPANRIRFHNEMLAFLAEQLDFNLPYELPTFYVK